MTRQYLAGELSWLLWQVQAVATDQAIAGDVARLRREAETVPVDALNSVAVRAIRLTDVLCWDSVSRGDVTAFNRQAAASADLYEFGVCAGLLVD
jgi:hypothetical protein